ncbi:MAG: hypothetical protein PWQ96_1224 [Clostridia bacterium]|jgi:uncharacterized membrane-anchored protein YitT (DUF2179 family)|nr:putative rane protein [Clostridiales bacterium]MDK2985582.1 hypothetical protein [Clostridia bacterium]
MGLLRKYKTIFDYIGITAGVILTALSLVWFLVPNKIAAGGVSGLATVVYHVMGIKVGITMLVINIPLFILSVKELGVRFGIRTLYGTITLSLFTDFFAALTKPLTNEPFLAALYGGVLAGAGLGMVFRFGGTTGGTDLAAQLIKKFLKTSVGQALLAIDAIVIALAGIFFNVELALYAMIGLFTTTKLIDVIQEGVGYAKAAFIISDHTSEIANGILNILNRGATLLKGQGVYTGVHKDVVLVVVSRAEVTRLKALVNEIDPKAFVIVTNVHEAIGEGFKSMIPE